MDLSPPIHYASAMDPIKLSHEEMKKLLYGIKSLDEQQRALIGETLAGLLRQHGHIWPEDLHRELRRLHDAHRISDLDRESVTEALFPAS